MSNGNILAMLALAIPLGCLAWNNLLAKYAIRPWMERGASGLGLAAGLAALPLLQPSIGIYVVDGAGILISGFFFFLTFMSRLPHQQPALTVGAPIPDFELFDSEGRVFRLSALTGTPVILKFYRGHWCPYCVAELQRWEEQMGELTKQGVRLIAISPDRLDEVKQFKRKTGWTMTLLPDPDNRVIRLYNLQNRNFTPKRGPFRELVIPTTILVGANGLVQWIDQATDFRARAAAASTLVTLRPLLPSPHDEPCDVCVTDGTSL